MRIRPLAAAATAVALVGGLLFTQSAAATTNPPPNPIVSISTSDTQAQLLAKAAGVTPSARQLAWQKEELTGFVHFGPNTYTGNEVGTGTESPNLIQPTSLDTDQWAASFKNAGFKKVILVAKHHDWFQMVRTLQPTAVMFGGPDIRWVGDENGVARTSEWSTVPNTGTADADGQRNPTYGFTATDIAMHGGPNQRWTATADADGSTLTQQPGKAPGPSPRPGDAATSQP